MQLDMNMNILAIDCAPKILSVALGRAIKPDGAAGPWCPDAYSYSTCAIAEQCRIKAPVVPRYLLVQRLCYR
jgi:hypothetical protein